VPACGAGSYQKDCQMLTVTEHLRQHLLQQRGLGKPRTRIPDLPELLQQDNQATLEPLRLAQNRRIQGSFRYGLIGDKRKPQYARIASMQQRLRKYEQDKNAEHLLDVLNLCLLAFIEDEHSFHSQGTEAEHHTEVVG